MKHIYVNMQDNYVACRYSYVQNRKEIQAAAHTS